MISEEKKSELLAYLMGELTDKESQNIKHELERDELLRNEFNELADAWSLTDTWKDPKPSEQMDNRFFTMLNNAVAENNPKSSLLQELESFLQRVITKQLMFRLAFLIVGVGLGFWMNNSSVNSNSTDELTNVRENLVLTLLEQPAANKRLQAVSEVSRFTEVDAKIVTALLKTLNNDTNDNVRIAAVESLVQFADNPMVRKGLIESISNQTSPLVQITLANTMVLLQEKNAKQPLQKLLDKEETNATVKDRLEKSIKQII
ncbi:HEAT repeat domain-containing protein [Spongiivirga citrea]|uniref:HEAT repeat domain-containing protein n=1 Tax=Spongiivirga citrea TaxID=1481457 RepID=A0A6M0CGN2_9FLAO|nr:HEAT repeat domain-containing protein [Spongiivirga citrea]NER16652.1 hypothetical protein [Spongiivirga citrea]